jgi:hypothetical protein
MAFRIAIRFCRYDAIRFRVRQAKSHCSIRVSVAYRLTYRAPTSISLRSKIGVVSYFLLFLGKRFAIRSRAAKPAEMARPARQKGMRLTRRPGDRASEPETHARSPPVLYPRGVNQLPPREHFGEEAAGSDRVVREASGQQDRRKKTQKTPRFPAKNRTTTLSPLKAVLTYPSANSCAPRMQKKFRKDPVISFGRRFARSNFHGAVKLCEINPAMISLARSQPISRSFLHREERFLVMPIPARVGALPSGGSKTGPPDEP